MGQGAGPLIAAVGQSPAWCALSRLEAETTQIQCTRKRVPTPWGCFSVLWMRARHYTVVCTLQAAASLPRLHLAPAARCFCLESVLWSSETPLILPQCNGMATRSGADWLTGWEEVRCSASVRPSGPPIHSLPKTQATKQHPFKISGQP